MYSIILVIILVILAIKFNKIDSIDATHPFGTDMVKNNKYAKKLVGEDYGVGTYWGKPSKNDNIINNLDKIQWLSNSCSHDVLWRRSIVISIFTGILISLSIDIKILTHEPSKLLFIIFTLFIISYFTINYYIHHFLWRRVKFINTHIRKIKSKLELPLNNSIDENPLI